MVRRLRSVGCAAVLAAIILGGPTSATAQRMLGASGRGAKRSTARASADAHPRPRTRSDSTRRTVVVAVKNPVAWQAALDRAGYSPGIIDGHVGRKSLLAIELFQVASDLPITGRPDAATAAALGIETVPATVRYTLTAADLERVAPVPRDWIARSRAGYLGYRSAADCMAETGHCTMSLLARLNPGVDLDELRRGDSIVLPNVATSAAVPRASVIEINLAEKTVKAFGAADRVVALFHCSIARDRNKRPTEPCRVKNVVANPVYLFDPASWPEVHDVDRRLNIPPGPRSPVGLCWIGLTLKGYGIHGTPDPEMIGKTGSHGCFRLTNWDARRLAKMVRPGTPVRFVVPAMTSAERNDTMPPTRAVSTSRTP